MSQSIAEELARVPMSPNLMATLTRAADYARQQGHGRVTLEHMLLALTEDGDAALVLQASQVAAEPLNADVTTHLASLEPSGSGDDQIALAPELKRVLEAAAAAAQQGRRQVTGAIVLAAIVGEGKSTAAQMLRAQGLTFEHAIKALQRSSRPQAGRSAPQAARPATAPPAAGPPANTPASTPAHTPPVPVPGESPASPPAASSAPAEPRTGPPSARPSVAAHDASPAPAPRATPPPLMQQPAATLPTVPPLPPQPPETPIEGRIAPSIERDASPPAGADWPPPTDIGNQLDVGTPPGRPRTPPALPAAAWPAAPPSTPPVPPSEAGLPPGASVSDRPPFTEPSWQPAALPRDEPVIAPLPDRQGRAPDPAYAPEGQAAYYPRPQPPPSPYAGQPSYGQGYGYANGAGHPGPAAPAEVPWQPPEPDYPLPPAAPYPPSRDHPAAPDHADHRYGGESRRGPGLPALPDAHHDGPPAASGQLIENIPRMMRVDVPVTVEVRLVGTGDAAHDHVSRATRAMSVRLSAADGGYTVESLTPETQWIEGGPLPDGQAVARWRWMVVPQRSGRRNLQLAVSTRWVGADGISGDMPMPAQLVTVSVRRRYGKSIGRILAWLAAVGIGAALALFGGGLWALIQALAKPWIGG